MALREHSWLVLCVQTQHEFYSKPPRGKLRGSWDQTAGPKERVPLGYVVSVIATQLQTPPPNGRIVWSAMLYFRPQTTAWVHPGPRLGLVMRPRDAFERPVHPTDAFGERSEPNFGEK